MKTRIIPAGIVTISVLLLAGCCTRKQTIAPVAIDEALESLGSGFAKMKQAELKANGGKDFRTGLVPSEAELTLAVSRAYTQGGKLYVEVSPSTTVAAPVTGKLGSEYSAISTKQAANTITVKFRSIVFQTTTTTVTTQIVGQVTNTVTATKVDGIADPTRLHGVIEELKNANIPLMNSPQ